MVALAALHVLIEDRGEATDERPPGLGDPRLDDRSKVLLLDHNGKEYKPLSRSQKNFLIGARYKPKPPIGFSTDIFRLDRRYEEFGDVNVSPLNPGEVFQSKVMPGGRDSFCTEQYGFCGSCFW